MTTSISPIIHSMSWTRRTWRGKGSDQTEGEIVVLISVFFFLHRFCRGCSREWRTRQFMPTAEDIACRPGADQPVPTLGKGF